MRRVSERQEGTRDLVFPAGFFNFLIGAVSGARCSAPSLTCSADPGPRVVALNQTAGADVGADVSSVPECEEELVAAALEIITPSVRIPFVLKSAFHQCRTSF